MTFSQSRNIGSVFIVLTATKHVTNLEKTSNIYKPGFIGFIYHHGRGYRIPKFRTFGSMLIHNEEKSALIHFSIRPMFYQTYWKYVHLSISIREASWCLSTHEDLTARQNSLYIRLKCSFVFIFQWNPSINYDACAFKIKFMHVWWY